MNEPYPGGPGGGYQPHPGGRRQPDQPDRWPDVDWDPPQRGQERGPEPRGIPGERGHEGPHRHGGWRRPELDQTRVDQIAAVDRAAVDQTTVLGSQGRKAGRDWLPANAGWALTGKNWLSANVSWEHISRNWALIVGVVFFLVDTFFMVDGFASPVAMASRVLVVFIWLISLTAVALLWLRGSSKFTIQNPFVRAEAGAHRR